MRCTPRGAAGSLFLLFALLLCAACGTSDAVDGGPGGDGGGAAPHATALTALEQMGEFNPAPASTLLLGGSTPVAIVGTRGALFYGDELGMDEAREERLFSGLLVLDRDTGRVDTYTHEDGLPSFRYVDPFGTDYGLHTPSFVALAWLEPDRSFLAATTSAIVRADLGDDGRWHFRHAPVRASEADEPAELLDLVVTLDGDAWVGTVRGAFRVDGDTLETTAAVPVAGARTEGAARVHHVALLRPTSHGAQEAVVLIHGPGVPGNDRLSVIPAGGTETVPVALPPDLFPLSLAGGDGRVLVGVQQQSDRRGAIWAVEPDADGWGLRQLASPRQLYTPLRRYVIPGRMLQADGRLFVSGRLGFAGGTGVIHVPYESSAGIPAEATATDLVDQTNPLWMLVPAQTDFMALDADGELWLKGVQLCSDKKLFQGGVLRLGPAHERLSRAWVSGVRDMARDTATGRLWLALRDGSGTSLACNGVATQEQVCQLRGDGSCQIWASKTSGIQSNMMPYMGASDLAFGPEGSERLAVATLDSDLFVRIGETSQRIQTRGLPGLGGRQTGAAWGPDGALWVASEANYVMDDTEALNANGPQGLGLFEFGAGSEPTFMRRYVRAAGNRPEEVSGLPSSMVYDVLPLEGERRALVALGVERMANDIDHVVFPEAPVDSTAGLVVVADDTFTVVPPPEGDVFRDVVALAPTAEGRVLALDATGVYSVDPEAATAELLYPSVWTGARPLSLAVDAEGRVAVGTSAGLWVFGTDGTAVRVIDGPLHFVWSLRFEAPGRLLAGTDFGLFFAAFDDTSLPSVEAAGPFPVQPWTVDTSCSDEGCRCRFDDQCAVGLACTGDCVSTEEDGYSCACAPLPTCAVDPGAATCACDPEQVAPCSADLACAGSAGAETCQ